jgi:chromosome segregation ATPase
MGNEEYNSSQDPDDEKRSDRLGTTNSEQSNQEEPSVPQTSPDEDQSSVIQDLEVHLKKLRNHLSIHQDEAQGKGQVIQDQFADTKFKLEKMIKEFDTLKKELAEQKQLNEIKESELKQSKEKILSLDEERKKLLQEKNKQIRNLEAQLHKTKLKITEIVVQNQELTLKFLGTKTTIEGLQQEIEDVKQEKEAYLAQIGKLQDIIQTTEDEIKEIEAGHHEIEEQLREEIKRTEERAGQISEDLSRETSGSLARDRHIRTVLQESDIGKVALFIVDYFENTKKRFLDLQTICSELGMTPIIARSHVRNLHGLGICEFNEVTREIKLIN